MGVPYLAVLQDKAEASGDRFERTKGIRGFVHSAKEQFGYGRCGGLPLIKFVICRTRFALAGAGYLLNMTGNSRLIYGP